MRFAKRLLLVGVPAVGLSLLGPRPSLAQWAVFDAANIVQTTLTAAATAETVVNTLQQIERMKDQINNQLRSLKTLDPTSFASIKALIDESTLAYQTIRTDAATLGFAVGEVNQDFDRLFPKDKDQWTGVKYSDYDTYYTRWHAELTGSAKTADRAQSSLLVVEKNNAQIAAIIRQSDGTDGEVRQLQLVNQQLGLIHAELGALVQQLATMSRVTANMAAASSGEKLLTREAKARRLDNYVDPGKPARVLPRFP
jgi:P-type conjugative transfer protein TrbJ